jgi:DNA (cytosine-5)-methyltransferase 1
VIERAVVMWSNPGETVLTPFMGVGSEVYGAVSVCPAANLFDLLSVDYFAGGGGASQGIERALGRCVDVAVNHDAAAIAMHTANHPHARHYEQDVFHAEPRKITGDRPVGLFWASPDCRHFSRAKGAKPVKRNIRGLAWAVVRFVDKLKPANRPRVVCLENVREFEDWGPLTHAKDAKGKPLFTSHGEPVMVPDHSRKGETFRKFINRLRSYGYHVEWRPLNAADYGAPTHRRRLFLVARRDGKPIRWPVPTHGPKSPKRRAYKAAASCIEWGRPCPSIFMSREDATRLRKETGVSCIRPLKRKTMSRIAHGLVRYVINAARPFVVSCNHGGAHFRGQPTDQPLSTLTSSRDARGLISPYLVKYYGQGVGSRIDEPVHTVTTKDRCAVVSPSLTPFLASRYGEGPHQTTRGQRADEPLGTITPANNTGTLIAPSLVQFFGGVVGKPATDPLPTVTAIDHNAISAASLAPFVSQYFGQSPASRGKPVTDPLPTVTADDHNSIAAAYLARIGQYGGNGKFTNGADEPLSTITSKAEHLAVTAFLSRFNSQKGKESRCHSPTEPLRTLDTQNRFAEVASYLVKLRGSGGAKPADVPLDVVCAGAPTYGPVAAYFVHMNHGDKQWNASTSRCAP